MCAVDGHRTLCWETVVKECWATKHKMILSQHFPQLLHNKSLLVAHWRKEPQKVLSVQWQDIKTSLQLWLHWTEELNSEREREKVGVRHPTNSQWSCGKDRKLDIVIAHLLSSYMTVRWTSQSTVASVPQVGLGWDFQKALNAFKKWVWIHSLHWLPPQPVSLVGNHWITSLQSFTGKCPPF